MIKDPVHQLERLERELGGIALRLTQLQFRPVGSPECWRPPLNAFRCADRFIVCVELAGVERSAIQIFAEPRRLSLRGTRAVLEPASQPPQPVQVLALEIDHGQFERVLELPDDVDPEHVSAEHREGVLWIQLPLRRIG